MTDQNELFDMAPVGDILVPRLPMVRNTDPQTSHDAAESVEPHITALHETILCVFTLSGPMTAKEAERYSVFSHLGFSTVRKRISELAKMGKLVDTGEIRDGCTVWRVA